MQSSQKLRAILVDDEELARQMLREYLETYPEIEIVAECRSGKEAVRTLNRENPDLVFLDIQMPEYTGFEVLTRLESIPHIIFSTAFDQYALKAFEVNAVDYLLKPYDKARFDQAVRRVLDRVKESAETPDQLLALLKSLQNEHSDVNRFWVREGGRLRPVKHEDIQWIEAMDDYVCLHVARETFLISQTMKEMELRLNPNRFMRIHRSSIVNLDFIKELRPVGDGGYEVTLKDGARLSLSRSQARKLREEIL